MNSQPCVCVVVPVYNAMNTLRRCVDSVLSQEINGTVCCVLVNDGSTDASGTVCDEYAAAHPETVRVVHQEDGGVSSARNAGLEVAAKLCADYIVFLDSDDYLLPYALASALAAQNEHPSSLVLWHFDNDNAARLQALNLSGRVVEKPQSALAWLYLACVIGMPWNKLYRADLACSLRFDTRYTLGEDLQYVLSYLEALGKAQPDFTYALVERPLTFYDCSKSDGTLSTRYLPDYCEVWQAHFDRLNAACEAARSPAEDLLLLHRSELVVLAEGVADILRRDPAQMGLRRDKALAALCAPWLRELLRALKAEHNYSAYYLPVLLRNQHWLFTLAESKRKNGWLYGKLDWAGYYLMCLLWHTKAARD